MKTDQRKKAGQVAYDLLLKAEDTPEPISVQELQEAAQSDYINTLIKTANEGKLVYEGDFFIEVNTKREKWTSNALRNFFAHRISCPTPYYDQSVYMVCRMADEIRYIWTIPCMEGCKYLISNAVNVHPDSKQTLQMVLDFKDGTLMALSKKLNNEKIGVIQYGLKKA